MFVLKVLFGEKLLLKYPGELGPSSLPTAADNGSTDPIGCPISGSFCSSSIF
jgi:hypothetical protein